MPRYKYGPLADSATRDRIASRRAELGLSLRQIEQPGITREHISYIENGKRNASIEALVGLAEKLRTTALFLMSGHSDGYCPVCQRGGRGD